VFHADGHDEAECQFSPCCKRALKKKELQLSTGSIYLFIFISLFVVYLMSLQLKRYTTDYSLVEVWPNLRCHRGTSGTNEESIKTVSMVEWTVTKVDVHNM
jgi:hypothetical protein